MACASSCTIATPGLVRTIAESSLYKSATSPIPLEPLLLLKQSHYRPGQAQGVLRKLRFPYFLTTAQDDGRLSAPAPAAFNPRKYS